MTDASLMQDRTEPAPRKLRLWLEFLVLFIGVPLALVTVLPPRHVFPTLGVMTLVGLALLAMTPGFRWRSLLPRRLTVNWGATLGFLAVSAAVLIATVQHVAPYRLFSFPLYRTELWLLVMALYPILSALPQELLYRALFFERYGALFGGRAAQMLANAFCFGLAHAFYANPIAITLSTLAGLAFAYAYLMRGSFALAALWHILGGQMLFTVGLGVYFYHGAAPS